MPTATATATRRPFSATEWDALKQCAYTLHRWDEDCCNGVIQYDDNGENPRRYSMDRWRTPTIPGPVIVDRAEQAVERARKIATAHGLSVYHQSDPRGCALYIYNPADLKGRDISCYYSSIGKPVV